MRRAFYGVPSKSAPQRKTPSAEPPKSGERWGFPQSQEIFFCQLKRKFVNFFSKKQKSHFLLFPFTPQKRRTERGECENFDNKRALKHFRRGEKRRQPQACGGCPLKIKRFAVSLLRETREASSPCAEPPTGGERRGFPKKSRLFVSSA